MFVLRLTASGEVQSVAVAKSTGNTLLDEEGVRTLRQWRFKAGSAKTQRVPLTWHAKRRAAPPGYPGWRGFSAVGRVKTIDRQNGTVTIEGRKGGYTFEVELEVQVSTPVIVNDKRAELKDVKAGDHAEAIFYVVSRTQRKVAAGLRFRAAAPSALRATALPRMPGFVRSPYPPYKVYDVRGAASGFELYDRESKKSFIVP